MNRATAARIFDRGTWPEARRIADILRLETVGGVIMLAAALLGLVWANSPWAPAYEALRGVEFGPESLHLRLSLGQWASDGLLAIFFFVAGLELKREFVAGDLRDPRRAAVPVAAAVGGVAVPALIYTLVNLGSPEAASGWAIPTATDIAFALAVLAVIGRFLPSALRTFLLTLAVVDDLIAIVIIALFYTDRLSVVPLLLMLVPLALFTVLVQRRVRSWWLLLPLAAAVWALMHASGVHATVAGVLLGFAVPVIRRRAGEGPGLAEHFEHRFRPLSTGVAVPVFAFFASGVALGGFDGFVSSLTDTVTLGVVAGLLFGKLVGITASTWLVSRFTRAELDDDLAWVDVVGLAVLGGIGFTVSLLVGELAFGQGSTQYGDAKIAVLLGSLLSALVATVILRARNRVYRRIHEEETRDDDHDGIPDVHQRTPTAD
ncbi:Na+/H+ antiporter NhaA [Actinosynnema sp. NPDC047251]|uniref:Na(+)/H(+) antiporter NhaA n=1 Tax=Saccharothrix espanaensis (strain ATCC 51144 / DSM 44229 / JCM 9112 / NBRC 15066 / NRRL 15764) TaxID=1179773 RepID=K0K2Y9_SACES|nr:Na+/H+ antiporter NhaA [Saccharothrix espanaensis]CCH32661.1 Na+/H+ antiporter [Saccharothrix espanaensis DSM 44229]